MIEKRPFTFSHAQIVEAAQRSRPEARRCSTTDDGSHGRVTVVAVTTSRGQSIAPASPRAKAPTVVGLFSGIGGLELGFERAGCQTSALCELWEPARRVLTQHFPSVQLGSNVRDLTIERDFDILTAGFPCTDLSPAGATAGISGPHSGLVSEVFRIVKESRPAWVVLENVPNMLVLQRGAAMRYITGELEAAGYRWAYRTVDARATGLPQRRLRVILLAARDEYPEVRLFSDQERPEQICAVRDNAFGFYWTEGRGGLGWAADAIPTLKGGSTIGIPSPPAVFVPGQALGRQILTLTHRDGERLQGFPDGWTTPAYVEGQRDHRWKLLGNAVPVDIATWVGGLLMSSTPLRRDPECERGVALNKGRGWPAAAWGGNGDAWAAEVSPWPVARPYRHLLDVIEVSALTPLSYKASAGFMRRVDESSLVLDPRFETALERHVHHTRRAAEGRLTTSWDEATAGSRARMRATRAKDTGPEVDLRRLLFQKGLRYRLQVRPVASLRHRADIAFLPSRVVVDVRGCFWHGCDIHGTKPKANAERWVTKLQQNRERDQRVETALRAEGWEVIVVWEHDDLEEMATAIQKVVMDRHPRNQAECASPI